MRDVLHIVAACTDRKRRSIPLELRVRTLRPPAGASVSTAADLWWNRLMRSSKDDCAARELYAGDHWATVLALPDLARGLDTQLWVVSAGYGLVRSDERIRPYGATFSGGHADSVRQLAVAESKGAKVPRLWWESLAQHQLQGGTVARSLEDVAKGSPSAFFLVVAGPAYLSAMEGDLERALAAMENRSRMILVSSPARNGSTVFERNLVPSTSKLQAYVGGGLTSLHARVAARILREANRYPLDADVLRLRYRRLLKTLPEPRRAERARLSDGDVRRFIKDQVKKGQLSSHTAILRELRSRHLACEQARFRELYREVVGGDNGASEK